MKSAEDSDGFDGLQSEFPRNVGCDGGKPQHVNIHGLPSIPERFEISAAEVSEAKVQLFARSCLANHFIVPSELISNRGTDEISSVGIEAVGDEQVYLAQVHEPEIDRDFLTLGYFRTVLVSGNCHASPSSWMVHGWRWRRLQGGPQAFFSGSHEVQLRNGCGPPIAAPRAPQVKVLDRRARES
jgi:hypothetical protein